MTAMKSCLPVAIVKLRDPESSAGTNPAPQTPHGCSFSDATCLSVMLTSAMNHSTLPVRYSQQLSHGPQVEVQLGRIDVELLREVEDRFLQPHQREPDG